MWQTLSVSRPDLPGPLPNFYLPVSWPLFLRAFPVPACSAHIHRGLRPCPAALTSDRQEPGYHTCSVYGRACSILSLRVPQCVHLQLPAVVICHGLPVSFLYPPTWDHLPKKPHRISNPSLRVCFWETQTRTSLKPALQGCVQDSTFFLSNVYYIPGLALVTHP